MTLTELTLVLFFLLLLLAAWRLQQSARELATDRAQLEEWREVASRLEDRVRGLERIVAESAGSETSSEEFSELVRRLSEELGDRAGLESENSQLMERLEEAEEQVAAAMDSVARLYEIVERAAGGVEPAQQIERLLAETSRLGREGDQLRAQNQNLQGQVRNLTRRAGGLGMDHPPCWADEEGRPEYMFNVVLHANTVDVRATWPDHRDDDARDITGVLGLAGSTVSLTQFSASAESILTWSKQQDPECRHFVRILDTPEITKEEFKANMLLVEDFFYKYLQR